MKLTQNILFENYGGELISTDKALTYNSLVTETKGFKKIVDELNTVSTNSSSMLEEVAELAALQVNQAARQFSL